MSFIINGLQIIINNSFPFTIQSDPVFDKEIIFFKTNENIEKKEVIPYGTLLDIQSTFIVIRMIVPAGTLDLHSILQWGGIIEIPIKEKTFEQLTYSTTVTQEDIDNGYITVGTTSISKVLSVHQNNLLKRRGFPSFVNVSGIVDIQNNTDILSGTSTNFITDIIQGQFIDINNLSILYKVKQVINNTAIILSQKYKEQTVVSGNIRNICLFNEQGTLELDFFWIPSLSTRIYFPNGVIEVGDWIEVEYLE